MEMEVLLTPLAAHAPCGDDLSFSSEFDTINEMRRADDATLNRAMEGLIRQCPQQYLWGYGRYKQPRQLPQSANPEEGATS